MANEAETIPDRETGAHIMVAGLSFQVLSFLGFIAVASNFAWNVKRERKFVRTLEKGSGSGNGIVVPESETRLRVKVFVYGKFAFTTSCSHYFVNHLNSDGIMHGAHPHSLRIPRCTAFEGIHQQTRQ